MQVKTNIKYLLEKSSVSVPIVHRTQSIVRSLSISSMIVDSLVYLWFIRSFPNNYPQLVE